MGQDYAEPSPLTGPGDISVLKPIGYPRPESDYRTLTEWVNAVLHEDKLSTDAELIDHIMSGGMSKAKADWIVSQRSEALKNPEYIVRISRRGDPMQKKIGEIRKMIKQSADSDSLEDQVKVELVRDYGLASQEVVALRRFEAGADLTMEDVTLLKGIKERVDQMPGMVSTEIRELAEDLSAFLAATPDAATIGGDETVDKMLDNLRSLRRELYKSIEEMWAVLRGMKSVADEILGEGNTKKVTVGDEAGGWNK